MRLRIISTSLLIIARQVIILLILLDLLQILKKHGTIDEFKAKELLLQVAEALQYLHSMRKYTFLS